ncbi:glycosyltransferase [Paenibacillus monticola]|uniref:4,4'-diaponeurosporenoate glycosyltransferase n=1 Tax=Paenibacillus monticola TaxID=2666075 RepID=A0A7X2L3T4_9BACL|nr:glycosyltransferase [Paenibacillus monticola]MRN54681.1 glycosyltransferase [Paenibacillus monticola]
MGLYLFFVIGCLSGIVLFRRKLIPLGAEVNPGNEKLSIIIPARNEAKNLSNILDSLRAQTVKPYEIIVVDDCSEDRTKEIAASYGVTVIENPALPVGWTGKTWAVWNGFLNSSGDTIAFLDADIRLSTQALESLLKARAKAGGVISVVPFHQTEKFYERLALIPNILGVFAFTSLFEHNNPSKGLYGSCIITSRTDYETINGHSSIRSELLDDLNLGARYREAGIPVTNFIGRGLVSFRMYPQGLKSELQGFGKGAVLSTAKLSIWTIMLVALWFLGLIASLGAIFLWNTSWAFPLIFGYMLYVFHIYYLVRDVGYFGKIMPFLHIFSTLFFLAVLLYSAYQVLFLGHVSWKGRAIEVGGQRDK